MYPDVSRNCPGNIGQDIYHDHNVLLEILRHPEAHMAHIPQALRHTGCFGPPKRSPAGLHSGPSSRSATLWGGMELPQFETAGDFKQSVPKAMTH